jgi:hypothetical protein
VAAKQKTVKGDNDKSKVPQKAEETAAPPVKTAPTFEEFQAAFARMRTRANSGDQRARAALIAYMDSDPSRWAMLGSMAKRAEISLIDVVSQGEWLSAEAVQREAVRLRERLSRPGQSPLEELAVARWVQAWIQLEFVESKCHRAEAEGERGAFWLRRQQQCHRILGQAERSLLLIRGALALPLLPGRTTSANLVNSDMPAGNPDNCGRVGERPQEAMETKSSDEAVLKGAIGVNRIGHLLAANGNLMGDAPFAEPVNGTRHLNGHELLLNGSGNHNEH